MEASSMRPATRNSDFASRISWDAVVTWVLGFGLVAYLGLDGGGYDTLVHDQVGIGIWWVLLIGVLVGALPRVGPSRLALVALGLLAGFVIWTALSLIWTESSERTGADLARLLGYLGAFSLILFVRAPREPQRLVAAVGAAIALIAVLALLSRLHPAWFPSADETARFLDDSRERLSYPLNYWNALGALIAVGLPLVLHISATAKTIAVRALAAAALPAMMLAIFFTLSRGSIVAAALATLIFLAVTDDRVPKLLTLAITTAGGAILIALASQRDELRHGLTNTEIARDQGNEVLLIAIVLCAAIALFHAGISKLLIDGKRPRWTVPSKQFSLAALGALGVVVLIAFFAASGPDRISNGIDEFKGGENAGTGTGRLNSFAGESRYDLWQSAVDENATKPLTGTGAGTFVYWWDRDAAGAEAVQDAHSVYLQTLGELGIIGLLLYVGFVVVVLGAGTVLAARAGPGLRSVLAAALAGCFAFFLAAAVDWTWQMPVLPVATLMLAAVLVMAPTSIAGSESALRRWPVRIALALGALVAIVAIAVPLASTSLIRSSEAAVRSGDLEKALEDARSAENVEPGAATPRLQQALVLELQGNLPAAAEAATEATERESTNWRTWLVLSRVEAERGNAGAALAAYREAKSLNPLSPLFDR
jgi:O-Antigen ligase